MIDDLEGGREKKKKNIDIIPAFLGFLTLIGLGDTDTFDALRGHILNVYLVLKYG